MDPENEQPPVETFKDTDRPDGPSELPPENQAPPPEGESEEKAKPEPAFKYDPRNEIYARRSEVLKRDQGESDEFFDEARQNGRGLTSEEPAPPAPPIANDDDFVTIKVYGKERRAPRLEVEQAGGVAAYQKAAAAEVKLQQAAEREAAVQAEEQRLLRVRENLRQGLDENGQRIAPASQPPAPGAANAISKEAKQALIKGLYSGDSAEAEAALDRFVAELPVAVTPALAPELERAVEDRVLGRIDSREAERKDQADVAEANRIFRENFKDIAEDPDTLLWAKGLATTLANDPKYQGYSRAQIATEVGTRINAKLGRRPSNALQARRELKRDLPRTTGGTIRNQPPEAPRPPTNADYIQQLRRNSGSNSTR